MYDLLNYDTISNSTNLSQDLLGKHHDSLWAQLVTRSKVNYWDT